MLNIGCHLSSSKGFLAMGKTALSIGANTFQFFTRNPRGGKAKAVNPEDAAALVKLCQENNFAKLLAHAPYTMNPCAADEGLCDFARNVMEGDLENVVAAVQFSKKVMRRIKENIFWAFAYNTILIPIAAGVLYPPFGIPFEPALAGLAMALSSVTVISLSLMLKRYVPEIKRSKN